MLKNILVIFSVVAAAYGDGQLTILGSPSTIQFNRNDKMEGRQMGDLLKACTGHSITESIPLKMSITYPFDLSETKVCLVNVKGVSSFEPQELKPKSEIQLIDSEVSIETYTSQLAEDGASVNIIDLNDGYATLPALEQMCGSSLKPENAEFVTSSKSENPEIQKFNEMIDIISMLAKAECGSWPNYLELSINLDGMSPKIRDKYLPLLSAACEKLSSRYMKSNNGAGIFAVSTNNAELKRTRRAAGDPAPNDINLAPHYSDNYPVIFNIILWFGVVIAFSLLAISYAIATMDPGRDSIIYRMTSTRIKKDN